MQLFTPTRAAAIVVTFVQALALPAVAEAVRFEAILSGDAQRPPVATTATGLAEITVEPDTLNVTWTITFSGLSGDPVAAHFHGPATEEETAPPVIDLGSGAYGATADTQAAAGTSGGTTEGTVADAFLEGSARLTEDQIADLVAGRYYLNIHTADHPNGEIRGQIIAVPVDRAALERASESQQASAAQAVPGADIAAGEKLFRSTCRSCHGPRAQGVASFPRLAGRDADYLSDRLETYHAGETVGPNSKLMIPVAQKLSPEDIANVSDYIAVTFQ